MPSAMKDCVVVAAGASDLAFQAGQLVERLLLDRSIEIASQAGASVVAAEHVESCLDPALFDELLNRVRENFHGAAGGDGETCDGQSREAA